MILEMRNIEKSFGTVKVLKEVNFKLEKGEVHALVGGNGAGKSTLMKIMTGVYSLDSGEVYIEGKLKKIRNAQDAKENGIAMIFQELSLVHTMTVSENIFLGEEVMKGPFRDVAEMKKRTKQVLVELGIDVDPDTPVSQLSVGMSQMIEIAKAISKNAKILVLDEPTASLSAIETIQLFKIIRDLKAKGVSMVYISHRMNEILEIADAITILRDGSFVASDKVAHIDLAKIISLMVGDESSRRKFEWVERKYDRGGDDLLTLSNVKINDNIADISFSLKRGEILGIAGLMGSGRTEILETIFGLRKKLKGSIVLDGKELHTHGVADAIASGLALVPEDRRRQGLVLQHSVKENDILPIISRLWKKKSLIIDEQKADNIVEKDIEQLGIVTNDINKIIRLLSGGNQQKVVIAKWLNTNPKVMMLDEPAAGVDIAAKAEIIHIIREFADKGKGVLLVSSELAELLAVCDRVIIMYDGKITGEMSRKDIKSEEELEHAVQQSN